MKFRTLFVTSLLALSLGACNGSKNEKPSRTLDDVADTAVDAAKEATKELKETVKAAKVATATATLESRSGSDVTGRIVFTQVRVEKEGEEPQESVQIAYEIHGLTPNGTHGFHIHETGDCTAPDATSAGGHFNPEDKEHGALGDEESHAGDFGNVVADENGNALGVIDGLTKITMDASGEDEIDHNIIGRAVIVHEQRDDLKSQPTGDAGGRIACGIIEAK